MSVASGITVTFGVPLLIDEDVPRGIPRGLRHRQTGVDLVRVQEVGLMNTPDPDILDWAARTGRVLVTRDVNTMTAHASDRIVQGLPMPGVIVVPQRMSVGQAINELEAIALASGADEWQDQIQFLPL